MTPRLFVSVVALAALTGGCAPRVTALKGAPAPNRAFPVIQLPGAHRRIVFRWDFEEASLMTRGEGAIRTAAPDSARVDLFLTGGIAAGHAVLIGDSLRARNKAQIERVLPPPPMMWAALGRLAIPPLPDTVVTEEGGTLYADVGRPATWRVTVKGGRLMQLARLSGGRIAELVTRDEGGRLLYEVPGRRKLWLGIIRDEEVPAFDPTIWTR
ncbi:MAG TPA: hypothetical protein VES88_02125 [Gemmatimonadaceae bacterium]|nr:hypothetical protein [Gemmatimonadaceae bacterium]